MQTLEVPKQIVPAALDEINAATYIGLSVHFLQRSRRIDPGPRRSAGPPFIKIGTRILYLKDDLDTYLLNHRQGGQRAG